MTISEGIGFGLAFVMGMLTSVHCVGMCGGFVLTYTNRHGSGRASRRIRLHAWYALGKLISYATLGALFGMVGRSLAVGTGARVAVAIAAGLLLVVYGLSTVGMLPLKRFVAARVPARLLAAFTRLETRYSHPLVFGLLSGLMVVCGPLQAMYVVAAGTGSIVQGALLLVLFGAGTLPLLTGFGVATGLLSYRFTLRALRVSGIVVILLGALMINRGVAMSQGRADHCHQPDPKPLSADHRPD